MPVYQIKGELRERITGFSIFSDAEIAKMIGRVRAPNEKKALTKLVRKMETLAKSGYGVMCNEVERVRFARISSKSETNWEKKNVVITRAVILESWPILRIYSFRLGKSNQNNKSRS